MASTTRDVHLPVLPHDAYGLARVSGSQIPSFRLEREEPAAFRIHFHRGFGWSNPIDVSVTVWQTGPQQSTLRYQASILALADPFGFMDKNLDRFQQHLLAHYEAWIHNRPPPAAPVDTHSPKVNFAIFGCVFGGLFLVIGLVVVMSLVR